jgi:hypothetical protein
MFRHYAARLRNAKAPCTAWLLADQPRLGKGGTVVPNGSYEEDPPLHRCQRNPSRTHNRVSSNAARRPRWDTSAANGLGANRGRSLPPSSMMVYVACDIPLRMMLA